MVDLDRERSFDNFLKGTEYDIFNQADNPAFQTQRPPQLFELQSDCGMQDYRDRSVGLQSHQALPFQKNAQSTDGMSEQDTIRGPFRQAEKPHSTASQRSFALPTNQTTQSNGFSHPPQQLFGSCSNGHSNSHQMTQPLQLQKQGSDEMAGTDSRGTPAYHTSTTNEYSNDTYSRSKGTTGDHGDSLSDEDDAIYVPFEYKGDGRKREAKKHKLQALVAQDEIMIDRMIRDYQNSNEKIIESERALDALRAKNISKKELQSKRNRLTAQLSRDRQKLEMSFLKAMCVNYQRLLRRLDKKLSAEASKPFCSDCWHNLNATMQHHRSNQTKPSQVNFGMEESTMMPARPDIDEEFTQPKSKRAKLVPAVNLEETKNSTGSSHTQNIKGKRKDKANNKGLIASSMMLSVVGMLNYMGNSGEAPICTQLNENFHDKGTQDQFREAMMQQLKSGLGFERSIAAKTHSSMPDPAPINDWSVEVLDDRSYDAGYDVD